jgi:hypothetical protein
MRVGSLLPLVVEELLNFNFGVMGEVPRLPFMFTKTIMLTSE